jgi:hypothetical protein
MNAVYFRPLHGFVLKINRGITFKYALVISTVRVFGGSAGGTALPFRYARALHLLAAKPSPRGTAATYPHRKMSPALTFVSRHFTHSVFSGLWVSFCYKSKANVINN